MNCLTSALERILECALLSALVPPMVFKRITISQLGPFRQPFILDLDSKVTILTGANDAGKTSALRAIRLLLTNGSASEADVNRDHVLRLPHAWTKDTSYSMMAEFGVDHSSELVGLSKEIKQPWTATYRRHPAPDGPVSSFHLKGDGREYNNPGQGIHLPACLAVGLETDAENVRSVIPLTSPNKLESAFLHLAFDGHFDAAKYQAMSEGLWEDCVSHAEERLNQQLRHVVPTSDHFQFKLRAIDGQATRLSLLIRDAQRGMTPFEYRGAGAKKLVQILVRLVVEARSALHRIILIDEPENSLHADAQHLLREFFYELCADGKTQVIYTTHSGAMLNSMRPNQVRLLERQQIDGQATTTLRARPQELGFFAVRSAWGVTVADSLMFSPITIVVEGVTEGLCLPVLYGKLQAGGVAGFEHADKLLGLSGFLDGRGQSLVVVARFAQFLGTKVILLVDGDNNSSTLVRQFTEQLPGVPAIRLPEGEEFENLVPKERYFEALAEARGVDPSAWLQEFDAWVGQDPVRPRLSFTKRVRKWLEVTYPQEPLLDLKRKPEVMALAVAKTPVGEVNAGPLLQLLTAIEQQLGGTSFVR